MTNDEFTLRAATMDRSGALAPGTRGHGSRARRVLGMLIFLAAAAIGLGGCDSRHETLESFTARWHDAVNKRQPEGLLAMLDAASQRRIREDLERLRGLPPEAQKRVIDQLGGDRVKSLVDLTPSRYFALLWHRLTDGKPPTMAIEAAGGDSAYMVLGLDGQRKQRLQLVVEGGRWAWVLPEQMIDRQAASESSAHGVAVK